MVVWTFTDSYEVFLEFLMYQLNKYALNHKLSFNDVVVIFFLDEDFVASPVTTGN